MNKLPVCPSLCNPWAVFVISGSGSLCFCLWHALRNVLPGQVLESQVHSHVIKNIISPESYKNLKMMEGILSLETGNWAWHGGSGTCVRVGKAVRWNGDIALSQVTLEGLPRAGQGGVGVVDSKLRAPDVRHCGVCGPFRQKVGADMWSW